MGIRHAFDVVATGADNNLHKPLQCILMRLINLLLVIQYQGDVTLLISSSQQTSSGSEWYLSKAAFSCALINSHLLTFN